MDSGWVITASVREALAAVSGASDVMSDCLAGAGAASIVGAVAIAVIAARRLSALLWRFVLSVISITRLDANNFNKKKYFN
jgi:hypothetical protein